MAGFHYCVNARVIARQNKMFFHLVTVAATRNQLLLMISDRFCNDIPNSSLTEYPYSD
jgi:hypothetical protein